MNESITGLGESFASAYLDKITQWSALEFTLPADDLSASFGLANDILRLEEEWQAIIALDQILQKDFLPEDLFEVTNAPILPPELQPVPSRFVRKVENYPFILPDETAITGSPIDIVAGEEQRAVENKNAGNVSLPVQDNDPGFPEVKLTPPPPTKNTTISFEYPESTAQLSTANMPAPFDTEIIKPDQESKTDPSSRQELPNVENLSTPGVQTSPQMPTHETGDQPVTSADSIWSQPLLNLGDFATRIVNPVIEKSEKVKLPDPSNVTMPDTDLEFTELNRQAKDDPGKQSETMLQPGALDPNFEMMPITNNPQDFTPGSQTPGSKPGIQPFEQETSHKVPDTDDLLEALTDRIIKDFHRYYP